MPHACASTAQINIIDATNGVFMVSKLYTLFRRAGLMSCQCKACRLPQAPAQLYGATTCSCSHCFKPVNGRLIARGRLAKCTVEHAALQSSNEFGTVSDIVVSTTANRGRNDMATRKVDGHHALMMSHGSCEC